MKKIEPIVFQNAKIATPKTSKIVGGATGGTGGTGGTGEITMNNMTVTWSGSRDNHTVEDWLYDEGGPSEHEVCNVIVDAGM